MLLQFTTSAILTDHHCVVHWLHWYCVSCQILPCNPARYLEDGARIPLHPPFFLSGTRGTTEAKRPSATAGTYRTRPCREKEKVLQSCGARVRCHETCAHGTRGKVQSCAQRGWSSGFFFFIVGSGKGETTVYAQTLRHSVSNGSLGDAFVRARRILCAVCWTSSAEI